MERTFTFLGLLCFNAGVILGQLSGTVTINSNVPPSSTSYTSFSAFAAVINTAGVNGPLVVNVAPGSGPYIEQVQFGQIAGSSAFNNVVINGNGCVLSFSATGSLLYTLRLNGTDHIRVDNLTIDALATVGAACELSNHADWNKFTACAFACPTGTNSSGQAVIEMSNSNFSGVSGDHNVFSNCTVTGGYYGIRVGANNATTPFFVGNAFEHCQVSDFLAMGFYCAMNRNLAIRYCTIDRPSRITPVSVSGIYMLNCANAFCEANVIRNMNGGAPTTTVTIHGFYVFGNPLPVGVGDNVIRNNIVSCLSSNGTIYGMYLIDPKSFVYHNTINLDDQVAVTPHCYGIYWSASTADSTRIRNNIVSVTRSGTGVKFCLYYNCLYGLISDYNVVHMGSTGGTSNHLAYLCGINTLSQLQSQGQDLHSFAANPMFTNLSSCKPLPTNTVFANGGTPLGITHDQNGAWRSMTTPDIGALESNTVLCSGTPTNSITGPTLVCAGDAFDLLTGLNSNFSGLTLSWESSVSPFGPFVPIQNANSVQYNDPGIGTTTWYRSVLTCTNPNGGVATAIHSVTVSGPVNDTVPYFEGFETLSKNDALPNCSWWASDRGNANMTFKSPPNSGLVPRSGIGFIAFSNIGQAASQYYTNGIYLKAGITYSASVWYNVDNASASRFPSLSLFCASAQNSSAIVPITTITPVASANYVLLDGLFTVPTTGTYYIGAAATATYGSSGAAFLTLDDLKVIIPCAGNGSSTNSVTLQAGANSTLICSGQMVSLMASGASSYSWSTGATTGSITHVPASSTIYTVTGTNSLSGCSSTAAVYVTVSPCLGMADTGVNGSVRVQPNPCTELLGISHAAKEAVEAEITDQAGRVVLRQSLSPGYTRVDVSHLAAGVYYLQCAGSAEVFKVVKR